MDRITSMTIFTTVVASGSFAAAAQRLNKSPASITMHVQDLEHRLGARLLNRTTRKLSLTEPRRAYFDRPRASWRKSKKPSAALPNCNRRRVERCASAPRVPSPKCWRRYSTRSAWPFRR